MSIEARPFLIEYPAKFVSLPAYNEINFDICVGFGLTLRQTIRLEIDDIEPSKRAFLLRKLENMLHAAHTITLAFMWSSVDDARPGVDVEVDHKDLIDTLEGLGYL
jgi:hypothetical protein